MKKTLSLLAVLMMLFTCIAFAEEEAVATPELVSVAARTKVGDYGQLAVGFDLTFSAGVQGLGLTCGNIAIENNKVHPSLPNVSMGTTAVKAFGEILSVEVDPFLYAQGFRVDVVKDGALLASFTADDVTAITTEVADEFAKGITESGLQYRLYAPEADGPLPLVIWFHGGGEGGTDNTKPLTANRGAVCFAEPVYQLRHPCVVLVPQSANSWAAEELDEIAAVAEALIADGTVDANRVYAVGLAAQQATLRFSAHHRDLLAAAMPIIYWKQFDEDWSTLVDLPMWCAIAENDFTREAPNMVEFCEAMKAAGNENVRCTIYTDAEMAAYGLFGGLTHWGWIPSINNAEMIDWLFSQSK